ncbi:MAG: HAD family hydrolase [Deltaproteobacteria bacterium]|nr:HAD family hydrolase [Deltaproteobacteria bacterium]
MDSELSHLHKLEQMLHTGNEDVIVINDKILSKLKGNGFVAVVFDFDGVLLREIGFAEKGYAWLVRAIRDNNVDSTDINVMKEDVEFAKRFRHQIKGKSIGEKITIFRNKFGNSSSTIQSELLVKGWYDFFKNYLISSFGRNPEEYCIPGARHLLEASHKQISVYGLTANEHSHAKWLMKFVDLSQYFKEIIGYSSDLLKEESKGSLLADLLNRNRISPDDSCYIGDGSSDVKAGIYAKTFTIGIANNEIPISLVREQFEKTRIIEKAIRNGNELLKTGCDILATSTMALNDIARYFGKMKM